MIRSAPSRGLFVALCLALTSGLSACGQGSSDKAETEVTAGDYERGPHRGRMLRDGDFALEVTIYEEGPEPLFRLYPYINDKPVDPRQVQATIALARTGPKTDRFTFTSENDYLTGPGVVAEPHSFDVTVTATHAGRQHRWAYASYEGRTTIAADAARAGGVTVERVGPATLGESLALTGRVEIKPEGQSEVHARYPGRVMALNVELGTLVSRGQVIARVESSESLQTYAITAPISGMILAKNVNVGSITGGGEPMLMIGDPTQLHAEFLLYPRDAERVRAGQPIMVRSLAGDYTINGRIEAVLPSADLTSQVLIAHVHLSHQGGIWRPGLGVSGEVQVASTPAPLAVRTRALQPFRDFTVVYARFGTTYEVRMLELGRRTPEWTEVLGGIEPGTEYVVDGAFLIRADVEKSGASHDH
ncbi:MAG: HlyD family efflux transporter periplasmic adaptor subunit [Brevundimonas sp.]|uniref:efflux RND transporter periplasmic adaptor subunit n=1 Tax=Brevundimonas sp. TaxID=1871086 RepID=UPI0027357409|nr:HlyD family efflux transporter periplasmic adaptor subunit [Brevundimonas sp.]MDP3404440.1 HlyD family efflux transporter periplasmic adaptor subunit [Brevundimonas sp.]